VKGINMKRSWEGTTLNLDLEDGKPPVVTNLSDFPKDIIDQFLRFGAATKLRNYTAGKDTDKARESLTKGLSELLAGNWGVEREKVELSDNERTAVIEAYIVGQKRMKGDTRAEGEIVAAWRALPADKREVVIKKHDKPLKKAMTERLKSKKGGGADVGI
jgi:hypothetical protein